MIRDVRKDDAWQIAEIYNHYIENTTVTFEEVPVTVAEMERRIAEITSTYPWLVAEEDTLILGYTYASRWKGRRGYRFSVESTVYLRNGCAGKGLGTALYSELLSRLPTMGMHAVMGGIALPNEASRKLHEKLGFRKVAHIEQVGIKFGKWIDVGYWELIFPEGEHSTPANLQPEPGATI
ncbi:MAG TPA: arsinothricin resistance N-acetyltransferase ArsN1 family B [Bacteroidota bacterium]|nr:arsinothricin resistance N-acetyltransferase ArsN1 family B [Bacteroidota bacterium]